MQYSQRDTKGVRAGSSLQEKNSKISRVKTSLLSVTSNGKGGHKDVLNPLGGLQHANHSRDHGTFLGREGSQGKTHLQSAMEKGQEHHRYCAVLMVGERTCPFSGCQQQGVEEKPQMTFWATLHCSSETADGGQE